MKILGIQNTKINTFKGSDKNNAEQPKNQDNNSSLDVVFLTPEFYMKLKNIKPYVICKTQQGDEYIKAKNLIIAPDITDKYLRRDNGIIDEGTILSFIKIYNSLLKDKIDQSNQNLMDYQNEKNIALLLMTHNANNPDDEKKIPTDTIEKIIGDVISSALFEGMSNLDRYGALQKMVEFEEQNREAIPSDAFEDTMFLFDLSGTKTGYDFSDMDTKKKFLERFKDVSYNLDNNLCAAPFSERLIEALKDKDGVIDYKLGLDIAYLSQDISPSAEPKTMVDCLRKWYKMSPEHRYEILYTASVLGKTFFGWNAETECMQDIMDLCFDEEGNFDKNKKDVILEQVKIKDDEIVNYSLDNDDDEDINEFIISKCDELIEMFG